jgi:hypothetical protein
VNRRLVVHQSRARCSGEEKKLLARNQIEIILILTIYILLIRNCNTAGKLPAFKELSSYYYVRNWKICVK